MTDPVAAVAPEEMTLDELRPALAALLPAEAAFDGWGDLALEQAAAALGIPPERARLAFPGGAVAMIDAWFAEVDRQMAAALPPEALAAMKVRERIAALVRARLAAVGPYREALRRALAILALPPNAPVAARLGWRAADAMWRLAGDTATGTAHYTKRATLAAVYAATLLALMDDDGEDMAATLGFLDRRLDGVMRFERLKARLRPDPGRRFSLVRLAGRLRYPAR